MAARWARPSHCARPPALSPRPAPLGFGLHTSSVSTCPGGLKRTRLQPTVRCFVVLMFPDPCSTARGCHRLYRRCLAPTPCHSYSIRCERTRGTERFPHFSGRTCSMDCHSWVDRGGRPPYGTQNVDLKECSVMHSMVSRISESNPRLSTSRHLVFTVLALRFGRVSISPALRTEHQPLAAARVAHYGSCGYG